MSQFMLEFSKNSQQKNLLKKYVFNSAIYGILYWIGLYIHYLIFKNFFWILIFFCISLIIYVCISFYYISKKKDSIKENDKKELLKLLEKHKYNKTNSITALINICKHEIYHTKKVLLFLNIAVILCGLVSLLTIKSPINITLLLAFMFYLLLNNFYFIRLLLNFKTNKYIDYEYQYVLLNEILSEIDSPL